MSFPAYDEYKNSGVGWLGEIPSNWNVVALKYIVSLKSGDGITGESIEETGEYPVYGGNGLRGYTDDFTHDGHYVVVGRQGALCGNINYANGRFWASEHAVVASPLKPVDTIWLGEMVRAMNLNQYSVSAAQPGLSMELVGNLRTVLPPSDEQKAISSFLDAETSKIDALVSEQRRLIELLKEKRQAVISHAVTKGLNPDVPMKESGIEWLGDVPQHWSVLPIKRVIEVKDGTHATPAYVDPDEDTFPLITSKDFGEEAICFDESKHISADDHEEVVKRSNTEQGDVLMSMIGGNIGKALIVQTDRPFSIKNVALLKTNGNSTIARLVLYYLQSGLLDVQIDLLSRGGAQGFLGLGDIRNLVFFKVPPDELDLIVHELDKRVAGFTRLLAEAKRAIELLQERRTALISAAVTGKIDVRDFACQETL